MKIEEPYVICIGRQFGSGGRELGRRLAEKLGIEYYDNRLLSEAATRAGLLPELVERQDEQMPGLFSGSVAFAMGLVGSSPFAGPSAVSPDGVYKAQSEVIRSLAESRSCVIVGRTADYVLRDNPRCISVFVHAPEDACVERILSRGDKSSEAEARAMCRKRNKARAAYYNFYTDRRWGHADNYHLSIDSSRLPLDAIVDLVAEYVRCRLA